jgi:hypothetical protein
MCGRPRPATSTVLSRRPSKEGSGGAGGRAREVFDVHGVRASGPDSLQILRDLVHGIGQIGAASLVVLLGEQAVLDELANSVRVAGARRSRSRLAEI